MTLSQSKQTLFTGLNNSDGNGESKQTNLFYPERDKSLERRSELVIKDIFSRKLDQEK